MTVYYSAKGAVRGDCGHRHRTVIAAQECARQDQQDCRSLGGGAYSDREPIRSDGAPLSDDDLQSLAAEYYVPAWPGMRRRRR